MTKPRLTACLFPGQGSQIVGQGRELARTSGEINRLLDLASTISGHALRKLTWEGPLDALSRTDVLQPSLAATSLGCWAALRDRGFSPELVAGHSLGEFTALCAAEVLTPEDALRLVCERGKLMQRAAEQQPGAMTAVADLPPPIVEEIVGDAAANGPITVANYNSPRQAVISGAVERVECVEGRLRKLGARLTRLPVSGAWHSSLMADANAAFRKVLASVPFAPPRRRVFLNVTGAEARDPAQLRAALELQMTRPVRWWQLMDGLIAAGARTFVEVGPGRVLRGLLRHIWPNAAAYTAHAADAPRTIDALIGLPDARVSP